MFIYLLPLRRKVIFCRIKRLPSNETAADIYRFCIIKTGIVA
jgi:hypothetical protein